MTFPRKKQKQKKTRFSQRNTSCSQFILDDISFNDIGDHGYPQIHFSLLSMNCYRFLRKQLKWFPIDYVLVWNYDFVFTYASCHPRLDNPVNPTIKLITRTKEKRLIDVFGSYQYERKRNGLDRNLHADNRYAENKTVEIIYNIRI